MHPVVHAPYYVSKYLDDLRNHSISIRGRRLPVFRGVSLIARNLGRFQGIEKHFDVFHSSWYPQSRPCEKRKVFAFMVHDMIAELFPEEVSNAKSQALEKSSAVKMADVIFANSESTKADLINIAGIDSKKIVVTPLATSIVPHSQDFAPSDSDCPYLLYVGKRSGYKNFSALLNAFRQSKAINSNFRLICFGGEPFSPEEQAQLVSLPKFGAGNVVRISGDDALLARMYAGATAFVCSSKYEGFGIPLLEAMKCGCPVVTTRGGALAEVGGEAPRYVDGNGHDAIMAALEALIFDRSALKDAAQAGLKRADEFSWKNTARLTVDAYLENL